MAVNKPRRAKKYFTAAEANATLPLVRAIVTDVTRLANDLHERYERLLRSRPELGRMRAVDQEDLQPLQEEFERAQERMKEYERELKKLGVYLKDYHTGLIDFPCWMDNREVYLCWRLGEPEVAHWHEIDVGFSGRQTLLSNVAKR